MSPRSFFSYHCKIKKILNMTRKILALFALMILNTLIINAQELKLLDAKDAVTGASRMELYLPCLKNKTVGVVANQSSIMDNGTHLIDTLLSYSIDIQRIYTPEHGFRGTAEAGAHVASGVDEKTGIAIVSLYGNNKKPTKEQLQGIDILLFDLQDVGCRFYTYISTMTYVMEAAAENDISVIVLDRPNPNGFYVDGPVLDPKNKSFVGMHCVPIVYGLTIGEYALMVNGEKWLNDGVQCDLTVIPLGNYERNAIYKLPVKPSPNLPNWESVYLYPSLCLFEGTDVGVGRGTKLPFQVYTLPQLNDTINLVEYAHRYRNNEQKLNLSWILDARKKLKNDNKFFNNYFIKLVGVDDMQQKINSGLTEDEIRSSWQTGIDNYLKIREKYLIY
jgi:uncharacterized protein YbbC (DUF1343 family)